jgi:putative heme uptake system protein
MVQMFEWLRKRAGDDPVEAAVFLNVRPESHSSLRRFVDHLRSTGYWVFAKPKSKDDSDIDDDLTKFVRERLADAGEVVIASNDAACCRPLLEEASRTAKATSIGFVEAAGTLPDGTAWEFVDLSEIPGLLRCELERQPPLDKLPPEGGWYEPYGFRGDEDDDFEWPDF